MYVTKKLNVMRTNTTNPSKNWCKEAYKNADVIIWSDNRRYYRMTSKNANYANFSCLIPSSDNAMIYRLYLDANKYTIRYFSNKINYS